MAEELRAVEIPQDDVEYVLVDERDGSRKFIGGTHKGDVWQLPPYQRIEPADAEDQVEVSPKPPSGALARQVGGGHYASRSIQPVEYAMANGFGYCESLALRYITRHRDKNGREDIEKAIHCLELLIKVEYDDAETSR